MIITQATVADIDRIKAITAQIWPETYVPIIGQQQVDYMLERFYNNEVLKAQINSDHSFLICTFNGEDAGFAAFSPISADTYKLHKLYVAPQKHSLGIGKTLLNEIVSRLKGLGIPQLNLNVNRYNTKAISFYYKFGFNRLYDEDIEIGNGYQMNDHVLGLKIM